MWINTHTYSGSTVPFHRHMHMFCVVLCDENQSVTHAKRIYNTFIPYMYHLQFPVHITMVKFHVIQQKKILIFDICAPHFPGFIHAPDEYTPNSKKNEISFNTIFDWMTLWFHVCVTHFRELDFIVRSCAVACVCCCSSFFFNFQFSGAIKINGVKASFHVHTN